jgi:hypothetical protein
MLGGEGVLDRAFVLILVPDRVARVRSSDESAVA